MNWEHGPPDSGSPFYSVAGLSTLQGGFGLSRVGTQLSTSVCGDENCWLPEALGVRNKANSPQDPSHHPSLLLDLFLLLLISQSYRPHGPLLGSSVHPGFSESY